MPIELIVNNLPFFYPVAGDEPGWGQSATDWAAEVTDVLNDLKGPNDILQTTVAISNNVSSFTNIASLTFNTGQVRSAVINYSVYRISTANPSGNAESGVLSITYDNSASSGNKWLLTGYGISGSSGLTFNITDAGQMQYKSTDIGTSGYTGEMTFRAKALES